MQLELNCTSVTTQDHFEIPLTKALVDGKSENALTQAGEELLHNHAWPGNVRELQNIVRCVVAFSEGPIADSQVLGQLLVNSASNEAQTPNPVHLASGTVPSSLDQIIEQTIDDSIRQ